MTYRDFLNSKRLRDIPTGFEPKPELMPACCFDFQRDVIGWACRRGRSALFEDCGLGKTIQQLAWAYQVVTKTNNPVLILAPLGVTWQTVAEGQKFGIPVKLATNQSDIKGAEIYVTNYEKLHRFDLSTFGGIALDESSILKAYDGKTRTAIIEGARRIAYKLACTATPAPNDFMELGNHAEFLGVMSRTEMLATFFVHDGGDTSKWRLKGHAETEFWKWMCSWAVNIRKPSDLGYDDGGFELPPLKLIDQVVESNQKVEGYLFALPASSMAERRSARKASLNERTKLAAELTADGNQWVLWCNLNSEAEELVGLTGAEEINGATPEDKRERLARQFLDGTIRILVTKPSIWGHGMNLQCCNHTALVGLSDSYEDFYQVIRRFWRFGQKLPVQAHVITSSIEGNVLANIKRKERDAQRMADEMISNMADISSAEIKGSQRVTIDYKPTKTMKLPEFINA